MDANVRNRRRGATRRLAWASWILIPALAWCGFWLWRISETGTEHATGAAEAAIVLGAAAYDVRPSPVYEERLRHAVTLHRAGRVPLIMLTGGRGDGARFSEAAVGQQFLIRQGVPASAILIEERSRTTFQNLVEARHALPGRRGLRVLIVSDPPHLLRALSMARSVGFDALGAPTPTTRYRSWRTRWPFALRELWFLHIWWLAGM